MSVEKEIIPLKDKIVCTVKVGLAPHLCEENLHCIPMIHEQHLKEAVRRLKRKIDLHTDSEGCIGTWEIAIIIKEVFGEWKE